MFEWVINSSAKKIENRRNGLLLLQKDPQWESAIKGRWKWMVGWLAKTDAELLAEGEEIEECNMCEKQLTEWLESEFSFCDEYSCGMKLCKACAKKIGNLSKELK